MDHGKKCSQQISHIHHNMENKFHRFLELYPATIDLKVGPFRIACIATASLVYMNRVFLFLSVLFSNGRAQKNVSKTTLA